MTRAKSMIGIMLMVAACSGPSSKKAPTAAAVGAPTTASSSLPAQTDAGVPSAGSDQSGLPADVETYYKTMVFIHGTAQLMARFDLAAITSSDDQSLILMLIAMPGVMDDHVIAANARPVPAGLEQAWAQAAAADAALIQALQDVLTVYDLDGFAQAVESNEALSAEAVSTAEHVLAAEYGASADEIAAANRAALTEMGEAYQTITSMLLVGQAQSDDGSE